MNRDLALLRRSDPSTSADPRIRGLVAELARLDYAPAPRPEFRDELRAQLVAITPRLVAEGGPSATSVAAASPAAASPDAAARRSGARVTSLNTAIAKRERRRGFGRPLGVAAACVAVLALGLGGAVWKAQDALPGDSLYGLKRASENVQLALTSGDAARGHEYLKLASTRVEEAQALLHENSASASASGLSAGGISPQTAQLIRTTLGSANSDVTSGSSLLGTEAVTSHSGAPLSIMTSWAPEQLARLHALARAVGNGPLRSSTVQAAALVHTALGRARTLAPQVTHGCRAARTDALGPIGCTATAPTSPSSSTSTAPTRHHVARPTSHGRAHGSSGPGTTSTTARSGSAKHNTSGPKSTSPTRPTLPVTTPSGKPSLPISIDSCGISVGAGPIGISLGACPTHS